MTLNDKALEKAAQKFYKIPLTRGYAALVDKDVFEEMSQYKWHTVGYDNGDVKAARTVNINGKRTNVYLHRAIMGFPDSDMVVDHINHNTLDNRRENLRICTLSHNSRNKGAQRSRGIPYKGVTFMHDKYAAQINKGKGKSPHIGLFETAEEAAHAYDREAIKIFGEYAATNVSLGLISPPEQENSNIPKFGEMRWLKTGDNMTLQYFRSGWIDIPIVENVTHHLPTFKEQE